MKCIAYEYCRRDGPDGDTGDWDFSTKRPSMRVVTDEEAEEEFVDILGMPTTIPHTTEMITPTYIEMIWEMYRKRVYKLYNTPFISHEDTLKRDRPHWLISGDEAILLATEGKVPIMVHGIVQQLGGGSSDHNFFTGKLEFQQIQL